MRKLLFGIGLVVISATTAVAQGVIILPSRPSGTIGRPVYFPIVFYGPANTSGLSFNLLYPDDAPYGPATADNVIPCFVASGHDPAITVTAVLLPGKIAFTVLGFDLSTGPIPFGESGFLGFCGFQIADDAPVSTVPLRCEPNSATASDVTGTALPVTCMDGALTIIAPAPACCGDSSGNGTTSTAEVTQAILALINRDFASDPAAQCSSPGKITAADVTKVILNLVNRSCLGGM